MENSDWGTHAPFGSAPGSSSHRAAGCEATLSWPGHCREGASSGPQGATKADLAASAWGGQEVCLVTVYFTVLGFVEICIYRGCVSLCTE